jgi:hypothetical protein
MLNCCEPSSTQVGSAQDYTGTCRVSPSFSHLAVVALGLGLSLGVLVVEPAAAARFTGCLARLEVLPALKCARLSTAGPPRHQGALPVFGTALRLAPLLNSRVGETILVLAIGLAISIVVFACASHRKF